MIIPPFLKKGDRIGIVAPARKISQTEMQAALDEIVSRGFEPVPSANLYGVQNQFSSEDNIRAQDINDQLLDPSIKAIICARGGYGCVRIVDQINWDILESQPKWIAGYSDITVFHNHLFNKGIASIHGTMPVNFHKNQEATGTLFDILTGHPGSIKASSNPLNLFGKAEGRLIGGNLSLVYALQGSVTFPKGDDLILFIEDLDEYLYHVDRMMMNLDRSGFLRKIKGLIVGGMTDMKDNTVPFGETSEEIIHRIVSKYQIPVCFDFPAGHIERNLAFIMGAQISLDVNADGSVMSYKSLH